MRVDCAIYRDGTRMEAPHDFDAALAEARGCGGFVWIGLYDPTPEEMSHLAAEFKLHPLAVEDALSAHQRAKLERYDDTMLFVVLKTLRLLPDQTSEIELGEIAVFVGDGYVVTVRHGSANPLSSVRRRLEQQPRLLRHGPIAVLYSVMDSVVDSYLPIADQLQTELDDLETRVFAPGRGDFAEDIYRLKRAVVRVQRAVLPLAGPTGTLAQGELPHVPEEAMPFLRDVHDHVLRIDDATREWNGLLSHILDANVSRVSLQQNDDMRRISAWAGIAAVPTMIAGIYGMNFAWMPELRWHYAYPVVLAIMLVICVGLHRAFKRSGWL
jgi:magnesium transporter